MTVPFDTTGATTDGLEHPECGFSGQIFNDVWYCWQAPLETGVHVETCNGTDLDTKLAVYGPFVDCTAARAACVPDPGFLLACNDDACGLQSSVSFQAGSGEAYLIRLGSYSASETGTGTFDIDCFDPTTTTTTTTTTLVSTTSTSSTTSTTLPLVDNGDGTITDPGTGLMWEKKDDNNAGGIHDKDNLYTWAGCCDGTCSSDDDYCQPNTAAAAACSAQTGGVVGCAECTSGTCNVDPVGEGAITTIWDWLVQLNAAALAGYTDWRIPEVNQDGGVQELETILADPCGSTPCVDSVFNNSCTGGCTVTTCSCTSSWYYWSSTTGATDPHTAWDVFFGNGAIARYPKSLGDHVRAVRGGP